MKVRVLVQRAFFARDSRFCSFVSSLPDNPHRNFLRHGALRTNRALRKFIRHPDLPRRKRGDQSSRPYLIAIMKCACPSRRLTVHRRQRPRHRLANRTVRQLKNPRLCFAIAGQRGLRQRLRQLQNKPIGFQSRVGAANKLLAIPRHRETRIADRVAHRTSPRTGARRSDRFSPARTFLHIAARHLRREPDYFCTAIDKGLSGICARAVAAEKINASRSIRSRISRLYPRLSLSGRGRRKAAGEGPNS